MKKILLIIGLVINAIASAQPTTDYTRINQRYDWLGGYFRALHVPAGTTPALATRQWPGAGAVYVDSSNHLFYFYSGGTWRTSGGSTNSNVGSAFRLAIPGTNNVKTIVQRHGVIIDSVTSNSIGFQVDTTTATTGIATIGDVTRATETKLNISDTTGKWFTDLYRRNDSVFSKNGASSEVFRFKDSTGSGGGGVTDGDKGDVTISGSGSVFTVDSLPFKNFKMRSWASSRDWGIVGDGVTDNTAKINSALTYLRDNGGGYLIMDTASEAYIVDSLTVPFQSYSQSGDLVSVYILGATPPSMYSDPITGGPGRKFPSSGVVIKTRASGPVNIVRSAGDSSGWTTMNHINFFMENLTVRLKSKDGTGANIAPEATAINMVNVSNFRMRNVRIDTETPNDSLVSPATTSRGVVMPFRGNFLFSNIDECLITGVYKAITAYEHTTVTNSFIDACYYGVVFPQSDHRIRFLNSCIARYAIGFKIEGSSAQPIDVSGGTLERNPNPGKWYDFVADLEEETPGQAQGTWYLNWVHGSASFVKTNPNSSRIIVIPPYGNTPHGLTAHLPSNVDTGFLWYDKTIGHNLVHAGGGTWKEQLYNGQTRNIFTGIGSKIGFNTDLATVAASTYSLNVYDASGSSSNLANFQSAAAFSRIRFNPTNANGQFMAVFASNGTDKWGIGMDIAGNGTKGLGIYNFVTSQTNLYINPAGDVNIGSNALTTPQIVMPAAGNVSVINELLVNQPSDQGAYNLQVVGNSHLAGDILLPQNGSTNRNISFGIGFGAPALTLYNGGVAGRYGWGLQSANMQLFIPATTRFSINGGGDLQTAGTLERFTVTEAGNVGISTISPAARLHLPAGTATASTAPLKFTSGTNLTTAEAGAVEYNGTSFFFSPSTTRLRAVLTDNSIPSNGMLPIGNGTNYTNALPTGANGISIAGGAGTLTIGIQSGTLDRGDYTPTETDIANISTSTVNPGTWTRNGDYVHYYGSVTITATSPSTLTTIDVDLPVPSDLASSFELNGTCSSTTIFGYVYGNSTNDRARIEFISPASGGPGDVRYHFMYKVTPP